MERDRSLSLLVYASNTGKLDLSNYDPRNDTDFLRVRWALRSIDLEKTAEIVSMRHKHQCALLASSKISTESWDELQKQAINSFDEFKYFSCPWDHEKPAVKQTEEEHNDIISAYERAFGKPGTPEHDALIAETNELLKLTPEQQLLRSIRRRTRNDVSI